MHDLQQLLEDSGFDCYAYRCRVYGNKCLAANIDCSFGEFFADVLDGARLNCDYSAFRTMKTDSMGMGMVVYFPGVEHTASRPSLERDCADDL